MSPFQEEAYQEIAVEIESRLREEGYLSPDITAVSYFLLKANIEKTEKLHRMDKEVNDLLSKAEELLKDV